ncbi:nucleoside recognition domain-containing protein [uncultured Parasutterella sp.]|uniref:nucleoside recognition domain-containing protein n=1 Tax=uncultured Parasutterella sp. TaxID=1263098 RepID=UPI0025B67E99|nr:nucleoside recognition domain-containing protein [uncultured Parasutterella sp.]
MAHSDFFMDPLGVSVEKGLADVEEQAAEQEVGTATFRAMTHLFDEDLGAFSHLLMVLLYIPCCASIGAMYREVGIGWTAFAALRTIAMSYGTATIVYQVGRFSQHPVYSSICIGVCLAVILSIIIGLRIKGRKAAQ